MKSYLLHSLPVVLCMASLARAQDAATMPAEMRLDTQDAAAGEDTAAQRDEQLDVQPSLVSAPYDPWPGDKAFAGPRPMPPRSTRGPLVPEPESARSTVELVAGAGSAFGWCFGASNLSFPCQGLEPGLGVSLSGLWRVTPFFAWGGRANADLFAYEPPAELDARRTHAMIGAIEIVARVYSSDEGIIDPYAELGLGAAALRASLTRSVGVDYVHSAYAPAAHAGGGIDFVLGRSARVGFAATLNQVFVPGLRRCPADEQGHCASMAGTDRGYVSSRLELGGRFTLALGNRL